MFKKTALVAMTMVITGVALAQAPRGSSRPRDREEGRTSGPVSTAPNVGASNARGAREAYVNTLYSKLQNRRLADLVQELYLKPEKVENDPAAIKGVEKFVDLISKHESAGKSADEAVELALRELRPDLRLKSEDLLEACK